MLMLSFEDGDTFTFYLENGVQGHAKLFKTQNVKTRIAFLIPAAIKVQRDTIGAQRAFADWEKQNERP